MRRHPSPTLIDLLRSTLVRLEQQVEVDQNEEAVRRLERSVLRTIAEVQLRCNNRAELCRGALNPRRG